MLVSCGVMFWWFFGRKGLWDGLAVTSFLTTFPVCFPCIQLCNWKGWATGVFFAFQAMGFLGADLPFSLGHLGWLRSKHFPFRRFPSGRRFGFPLCGASAVMLPSALLLPPFLKALLHFGRKLYN